MTRATGDNTKRKRPAQTGQLIGVRLQPEQLAALDRWIAAQLDCEPSRPEAIRQLIEIALEDPENPYWTNEDFERASPLTDYPDLHQTLKNKP